jgi:alpha-L-rhamnosidase
MKLLYVAVALAVAGPAWGAPADNEGWITHPAAAARTEPVILHFRRDIRLTQRPATMPVTVTADNRFILFVNGKRVASGPSTGTLARWRTSTIDLAPHLQRGPNVVAAVVWDFVRKAPEATSGGPLPAASALPPQVAPIAWQSAGLGFRLVGSAISTDTPGWRVKIDTGHSATNGRAQVPRRRYYVASAPEIIDAAKADWNWAGPAESGGWEDAVPSPHAAGRTLIADPLPPQRYASVAPGTVVRTDLVGGEAFPGRAVTVPANTRAKILLRRDAMVSAYPELDVSGGGGATIKLTYTEALYDAEANRGDRDLVGDRQALGVFDTFVADGARRTFAPLWWRTWRYAELDIQTGAAPLTLEALRVFETGYPFQKIARFHSSDAGLNRIWDVGWRTAEVDAHETYMDSSYWEQLQYTGDTRLQMLISYAVAGDPRLAQQAIESFAESDVHGGLQQGAYPSRSDNVIATFSLAWVGMLSDWAMEQPDTAFVVRQLPRLRTVLDWFEPTRLPNGLLGKNPHWNFIDWVQSKNDRELFPSFGKDGGSCLMTVQWLGALRQGAALEAAFGDGQQSARDTARADAARDAIRRLCWNKERGLFADNADFSLYSQHMNALAVLYDVATPQQAPGILDRITVPGKGIDAPAGMFTTTYYFAWYLIRAFEHAGKADRYLELMQTWRELLDLHYTTWPESRGDTRSDTHAWSAHPTADLLGLVAGIRPAAPGYARLRVAPLLGQLTTLDATSVTPKGPVSVRYRVSGGSLTAEIDRPAGLPGEFVWKENTYPLTDVKTRFVLN